MKVNITRDEFHQWVERASRDEIDDAVQSIDDVIEEGMETNIAFLARQEKLTRFASGATVHTPAQAIGERAIFAWTCMQHAQGWCPHGADHGESFHFQPRMMRAHAHQIDRAHLFLWSNSVLRQIQAAPNPPPGTYRVRFPYPSMWWTFESSLNDDRGRLWDAGLFLEMGFTDDLAQRSVIFFGEEGKPGETRDIMSGVELSDVWDADTSMNQWLILKCLLFLETPLFETHRVRPDRGARRAMARLDVPAPEISVIVLRDAIHSGGGAGDGEEIEHEVRWWVRGHWRQQWHPSTKTHELTWIDPHIKGPEGKPIKPHLYAVTR